MSLDSVRISSIGRDNLIRLKRLTGIQNWNVLCRWALCVSMAESASPSKTQIVTDSNIEMSWKTFGGTHDEIYRALVQFVARRDGFESPDAALNAHIHRGLSILLSKEMKEIEGILI